MRDDCAHVRNVGDLERAGILRNVLLDVQRRGLHSRARTAPHATPVSCPAQVVKIA
jgi:hypothetical protein